MPPSDLPDILVNSVVGDYEIVRELGRGGMGVVYQARQISLDRWVALKVLPVEMAADQEYVDRFLREARAAAQMNHPNIIQVYDAGIFDRHYFFVMEFVVGRNLAQIVQDQGPMDEKTALQVMWQVSLGLAYAHGMGVVHRDIKPDNIIISEDGVAKIGDLGLAKWEGGGSDHSLTVDGSVMGTPNYISPEQIRAYHDLDGRTDIYSLGATLFYVLAGRPPFVAPSAMEIMAMHLAEKVPPVRSFNPRISSATEKLIQYMMEHKREERPSDMLELGDMIGAILDDVHAEGAGMRDVIPRELHLADKKGAVAVEEHLERGVWGVFAALVGLLLVLCLVVVWLALHRGGRKTAIEETPSDGQSFTHPAAPARPPFVAK
ncbi:MAG: serine/threonine-protein kinase [Verrucomicrobiae bacterium]|nr:serine/threonine-protein kinase [Verrucomicrobiae bacterium]